jgi:hypothetical protein
MCSTSIVKKSKKFVWGYPTEFAGSTQKNNKMARTPYHNLSNRKKSKKSMLVTSKVETSQKFVNSYSSSNITDNEKCEEKLFHNFTAKYCIFSKNNCKILHFSKKNSANYYKLLQDTGITAKF